MSESQFQDIGSSFIRVSSVQNQFYEYKQEIKNLNQQITGLVESKNQMGKQLKRYFQLIQQKDKTIHTMSISVFQLSQRILWLDQHNHILKEERDQSDKKYHELLQHKVKEKDEETMSLGKQWQEGIAKYEESIKSLEQQLAKAQQQVSILSKTITEKEQQITQFQTKTQTFLAQISQLNQEIASLKLVGTQKNNTLKTQASLIESTIVELQNLLYQSQKGTQTDCKASPVSQTEELLARLQNYEDEKKQLQQKVHYQELQILDRKKKSDDLESIVTELREQVKLKQEQKPQLEQKPQQELKVFEKSEIQKLYNQVLDQQHKYESEIKKLSKKYEEQVKKHCQLAKTIVDQGHKIQSLKDWNTHLDQKIVSLTQQNLQLKQLVQSNQTQRQNLMRQTRTMQQCQYQLQTLKQTHQKHIAQFENHKKVTKLQKQQQILELNDIKKLLNQYIVQVTKGIKTLKLSEEYEKSCINDELKNVRYMCKQVLSSNYPKFFNDNPMDKK